MSALAPGQIPTIADLESAGADAGALMDATRWELERAIGAARDRSTKQGLADGLKRLDRLHDEYFGGAR